MAITVNLDKPPPTEVIVTLKVARQFYWRIALATWVLRVAGLLLNWELEFVRDETDG